mgnify:CR=1 FL=1
MWSKSAKQDRGSDEEERNLERALRVSAEEAAQKAQKEEESNPARTGAEDEGEDDGAPVGAKRLMRSSIDIVTSAPTSGVPRRSLRLGGMLNELSLTGNYF